MVNKIGIWIGNINKDKIKQDDIINHFESYGSIDNLVIKSRKRG